MQILLGPLTCFLMRGLLLRDFFRLIPFFFILVSPSAYSQYAGSPYSFQTPNSANFSLYTDVPVSLYTGTPAIEIPIYQIKEPGITIPISLDYHLSSVRVHNRPSWVGLGWSLSAGGHISRQVHGKMDEMKHKPMHIFAGQETGFYSNYTKLAGSDSEWSSPIRLQQYANEYVLTTTPMPEAMADEFNFSFLGYSGQFYRTHDGQWKVISDTDIKVEFDPSAGNGFISESQLRPNIRDRINALDPNSGKAGFSDRYFNKFTLITPDGNRFEFGGPDATEYSAAYVLWGAMGPVPVTWFLSKITTASGAVINFNYSPGPPITALYKYFTYNTTSREGAGPSAPGCASTYVAGTFTEHEYDGLQLLPVYLASITYPSGEIFFDKSSTNGKELRWPTDAMIDADCHPWSPTVRTMPVYFEPLLQSPNNYTSYGAQRTWYQLDKIRIYDFSFPTNPLLKVVNLSYTSSNPARFGERLKLLSVEEAGWDGLKMPPYLFSYNPRLMPSYGEFKSNDHWDFYNGYNPADFIAGGGTIEQRSQKYYAAREPDRSGIFMKSEVLEGVQFPTGGFVKYEYEPHSYSKVVDRENATFPVLSLNNINTAGGLRIKAIRHYADAGASSPTLVKEYLYCSNYVAGADLSGFLSSGVLAGFAKYFWQNYTARVTSGSTYTYSIFSSGSVLPIGINTPGTHIGYSEVIELQKDEHGNLNGYTKHKFSNFDPDIWGLTHPDEVGISIDPSRSVYSPYSTNERQRGKPLLIEHYTPSNQLVRSEKFKYGIYANGYVRRVQQDPFMSCTGSSHTVFVTAYKTYGYRYNLIQKEVSEYEGPKVMTTTFTYDYNAQNLLSKSTKTTSDAGSIEVRTRYPLDFTSNPNIQNASDWEAMGVSKLIQKNIINSAVETITLRNGKVKSANLVGYKVYGGNVFPHKMWNLNNDNLLTLGSTISKNVGLEQDKFNPSGLYLDGSSYLFRIDEHYTQNPIVFDNYDEAGNAREIYKTNGLRSCYLMGYRQRLPIAEIVGATFQQVSSAGVDLLDLSTMNNSDATIRSKFATLRNNLPNAQITGYTYGPFGLTSKVDANGFVQYYSYDTLGRLLFVKDHDGKIIQAHKYNFAAK